MNRAAVAAGFGVIVFVAAACTTSGSTPSSSPTLSAAVDQGRPVGNPNGAFRYDGAMFATRCDYSHSAPDDPIVAPGRPGDSHLHDFFGNPTVDAYSTAADLLDANKTTCDLSDDTASYWSPALIGPDGPIASDYADAYYRVAPGVDAAALRPYPLGLAMVAGDALAGHAQPTEIAGWGCGHAPEVTSEFPTCSPERPLTLRVTFPDCWDGKNLDSTDHKSHVVYSGTTGCPSEFPVPFSQLTLLVAYPVDGDPAGLTLAAGPARVAHADFLNAWQPEALATNVRACLGRGVVCSVPTTGSP